MDADHAGDEINRCINNRILIFVNYAPMVWNPKRQATIESYMFGSEVVALSISLYIIKGIQYKLRMMGVSINGPAYMFGEK